jgi:hypothetical protein
MIWPTARTWGKSAIIDLSLRLFLNLDGDIYARLDSGIDRLQWEIFKRPHQWPD